MKKILIVFGVLLCNLSAQAQFSYISTNGPIWLVTGDITSYDTPDIYCDARYFTLDAVWIVTIKIQNTSTTDYVATLDVEFAQATVDALTGSGGTETRLIQNTILQAVVDYLEAITENAAVTFTLN